MRNWNWLLACLVALTLGTLSVACGDDGGTTAEDTNTTSDVTNDSTADVIDDSTAPDTNVAPDTTPDTTPPPVEVAITWPATAAEYTAESVSYVNSLVLPVPVDDVPTCCFDWGPISKDGARYGTDNPDNALASLAFQIADAASLAGSPIDLQATIDDAVQAGQFAILFDHREFSGTTTDADNFVLAGLFGTYDAATTWTEASAGLGQFIVNASSFVTGGEPLITFNPSKMNGGAMSAGPDAFFLTFPLGVINLEVEVSDTRIDATASVDANGAVSYAAGTLSGFVTLEDLVAAMNAFVTSDTCTCLGLVGDLYSFNSDGTINTDNCLPAATVEAACALPEEMPCAALAGGISGFNTCTLIPTLLESSADIDLDGDCATDPVNCDFEALSVGLQWTAVPGTVSSIQ